MYVRTGFRKCHIEIKLPLRGGVHSLPIIYLIRNVSFIISQTCIREYRKNMKMNLSSKREELTIATIRRLGLLGWSIFYQIPSLLDRSNVPYFLVYHVVEFSAND